MTPEERAKNEDELIAACQKLVDEGSAEWVK